MNNKKGFTLIELLVVIAIIGILSSVVLASLGTARNKGKIAAIKAGMSQVRTEAAVYADSNPANPIGTVAAAGTCVLANTLFKVDTQIDAMITQNGNAGATGQKCYSTLATQTWSYGVTLPDGTFWCVDSTGASKAVAAAVTADAC